MNARFPTIVLLITAAVYAGFAIWLGSTPGALLKAFGVETSTPAMLTEIRAFYGGIEMGIAAVMLVLWKRRELFAALLVGGLPLAGSAIGRCCGQLIDGFSAIHVGLAIVEAIGATSCLAGCYVVGTENQMTEGNLEKDGFRLLRGGVDPALVQVLLDVCARSFQDETLSVRARSSRGHVYAARNLIESIPEVTSVWKNECLLNFLREQLGDDFGLVRVLFFDKPPDRTWTLPWHKDTSIAVQDNRLPSASFSRPTTKAGVPHVIACGSVLERMLTLRIHLDPVTDENGPLRVIPGSHVSSESSGLGVDAAVAIHADAGDVLAMRPMLSHCSGPSAPNTRRHRRILHLEFAADLELPDGYRWHTFIRPELINS